MISNSYLFDIEFLEELSKQKQRELYVRISILDNSELPLEYIEGKILDGSINVDGKSIIRRTCNLSMVAEDVNITSIYWGLQNKFTLEIGLKNEINKIYPDIVWFKQGLFIITQFNTTQTTNKWEIKISGKDKMCLLNGDISGNLPYEVDFGKQEYHDLENDTITYTYVPVKEIIRRAVQEFGGEAPQNIIINDIDDEGLILLTYMNETPAYLYKEIGSDTYRNIVLNGEIPCLYKLKEILTAEEYSLIPSQHSFLKDIYINDVNDIDNLYYFDKSKALKNQEYLSKIDDNDWFLGSISDNFNIIYENLVDSNIDFINEPTIVKFPSDSKKEYTLAKIEYGDMPGYFLTDLTYASGDGKSSSNDLIAKAGESITSVLDKIKNMLVHFEYYYDINGKFVFQKKRDYIITPWNNLDMNNNEYTIQLNSSNMMFSFIDGILISSFSNNPKINNIKNDYAVWGSYNNNGTEIPIHMRYAIDKKPFSYKPIRPLKEKIHTIIEKDGEILNETTIYKYYDAPEIEPYDDRYLTEQLEDGVIINGFQNQKITVQSEEGYIKTTEIYPFFAKEPYGVDNTYTISYNNKDYPEIMGKIIKEYDEQNIYKNFDKFIEAKLEPEIYEKVCIKTLNRCGVDWRELIYQMALDYRKCNYDDNFLFYIAENNPQYSSGKTGYEQYYIDLEGFWRTLYNPNPQLQYQPIKFNEVKTYAPSPTERDCIFIEDGYRKVNYEDINNSLKPIDLYFINTPKDNLKGMYPFVKSDKCHLVLNQNYYLNENGTMKIYCALQNNDTDYTALNRIDLNSVYVRNSEMFLDAENNYYLLFKIINENKEDIYERLNVTTSRKGSGLQEYSKLTDVLYWQLLNNNPTLENFYIQDNKYLKYSDVYNENLYASNLEIFKSLSSNLEGTLTELKFEDYLNKEIKYLYTYLEAIKSFALQISQYNFTPINNKMKNELNLVFLNSLINLPIYLDNFITEHTINSDNSCLIKIFENFKQELKAIRGESVDNISILKQINLIRRVYEEFEHMLSDIESNYIKTEKLTDTFVNELQTLDDVLDIITLLSQYKNSFESLSQSSLLEDSQVYYVIKQLDERIVFLSNNEVVLINQQKQDIIDIIVKPILALQEFLEISYKNKENIIISLKDFYINFILMLKCIQQLPLLLEDKTFTQEEIISIISYKKQGQSIPTLIWEQLSNATAQAFGNDEKRQEILNSLLEETKDYQEYLITNKIDNFNNVLNTTNQEKIKYYRSFTNFNQDKSTGNFWSLDVQNSPQTLLFWFDFLNSDNDSELSKISISTIGDRTKVVNDKNVKAINYKTVPQVIFKRNIDKNTELKSGYTYINVNNSTENFFRTSSKGKSAKEKMEELLYTHSYGTQDITITSLPIYHLEPNHHILVRDDKSQINGEYIVTKMTIPLSFKKTMNITASKVVSTIA